MGRCEQLANNDTTGEYQFPSFVEYTKSSVVTGLSAKRNMGRTKHYVVACVKRLIGLTYDEYEKLENKDIFGVKSFVERMAILASLSRIVAVKWDALK